eukprot:2930244-Pyramimonas_sp.AAC.1
MTTASLRMRRTCRTAGASRGTRTYFWKSISSILRHDNNGTSGLNLFPDRRVNVWTRSPDLGGWAVETNAQSFDHLARAAFEHNSDGRNMEAVHAHMEHSRGQTKTTTTSSLSFVSYTYTSIMTKPDSRMSFAALMRPLEIRSSHGTRY